MKSSLIFLSLLLMAQVSHANVKCVALKDGPPKANDGSADTPVSIRVPVSADLLVGDYVIINPTGSVLRVSQDDSYKFGLQHLVQQNPTAVIIQLGGGSSDTLAFSVVALPATVRATFIALAVKSTVTATLQLEGKDFTGISLFCNP